MKELGKIVKRLLPACALPAAVLLSLAAHDAAVGSRPFFTTSSPGGTYTVKLTGRKEQPYFFTNVVNYRVVKAGQPFLPSAPLHSGDFLDLSFEDGYPDSRWIGEGVLQFYREQFFKDAEPDTLTVVNESDRAVKYLEIHSVDKLLFFDLRPGAATRLSTPGPRADYRSLYVRGEFHDGGKIRSGWTSFKGAEKVPGPSAYYVRVRGDSVTFEGPRRDKPEGVE